MWWPVLAPAASFVISVRTPSSGVIRKLTPKPAATPAKAAAMPAKGLRPTLLNAAPPSGISTRYPASEAMLEMIPSSTMMNVKVLPGETPTSLRISAAIGPDASAGQQAADLDRLRLQLVVRRRLRRRRADVGRLHRAAVVDLLGRHGRRFDHLERRLHVEPVEDLREEDDDDAEREEQDCRVRHLVPRTLDAVEDPLEEGVA